MFKEVLNDKITLIKNSGDKLENIEANVQAKLIFVFNEKIPFETGDIIERTLPSGIIEKFKIIDPGFNNVPPKIGIPNHYQIKIEKLGIEEKESSSVINHFHGNIVSSQIQQQTQNSIQEMSENEIKFNELPEKIREVEMLIPQFNLGEKENEFREKLSELKEEINKERNPSKIKTISKSLVKILSGAASSIVASGAISYFQTLL